MVQKRSHRKKYVPAVTPGLGRLLVVVFGLSALLGANSCYLVAVTLFEALSGRTYQNYFYQYMFLGHLVLGLVLILPFVVFGLLHIRNAWRRKNRRAVWIGYFLFATCLLLMASGLLLTRVGPLEIRDAATRNIFYWIHVICPVATVWLYCLHRLAGPPIKWRVGLSYLTLVGVAAVLAVVMHQSDPRVWYQAGSEEGAKYFEPSLARTSNGKFIPQQALQNDAYCKDCHADVHAGWAASAHRFSSFNNPAYLASVRETRTFSLEREGSVRRSRWCAGCHDPVPFFSGEFDNPQFDDVNDPTAHAGITCTSCHAITNVNSVRGNADYTIEEPLHYPFAYSENTILQWVNRQLVKAKPSFHKKTFLKPFHQEPEFCATCHKVHLPKELNDYKWLRGQNHHDSYHLSGVSGHGARSFYYPDQAHADCNRCHMPFQASDDFAAQHFEGQAERSIHDHLFVGANTALPHWRGDGETVRRHQAFLADCARVDIFGVRQGGRLEGELIAPLRPAMPILEAGETYLLETVIRTLTLGHHLTQGTADSNELWLRISVTDDKGETIGRSGFLGEDGAVDPWAHFVNAFMLDRDGNRIDRRNAQDIFVPLYNHQIPPGAGQTVHYRLRVPEGVTGLLKVKAELLYRKFDSAYVRFIKQQRSIGNELAEGPLPVTVLAEDTVSISIASDPEALAVQPVVEVPTWQRWNDYGIGLLLKGTSALRQAEFAFEQVEELGRYDGPMNLARVYFSEGRLDEAVEAIARAAEHNDPAAPPWTLAWLSGLVNRQQGHLRLAEENFRSVLSAPSQSMRARGFDFREDYVVRNLLGQTLFDQARRLRGDARRSAREAMYQAAIEEFEKTLTLDPENVDAHYHLQQLHQSLGHTQAAQHHRELHLQYKPDDNARDQAVAAARKKYPPANHAAEAVVIYDLHRSIGSE